MLMELPDKRLHIITYVRRRVNCTCAKFWTSHQPVAASWIHIVSVLDKDIEILKDDAVHFLFLQIISPSRPHT